MKQQEVKLPVGVEIHGNRIRIQFMYKGKRCRETLPGTKINKATIAYAERKRLIILTEIEDGSFNYALHFPESKNAALFSGRGGPVAKRTVSEAVTQWLESQTELASSTYTNYRSKSKHVVAKFGQRRIADISHDELKKFRRELLEKGISPKTVNDVFTIVRAVWSAAFEDGVIGTNPLDRIVNLKLGNNNKADPFTLKELEQIQSVKTRRQEDVNMVMFACWCGLSASELIALSWEDVDTEKWTLYVRRAKVEGEYKVPKEACRVRRIDLIEPAKRWLQRQMKSTYHLPPRTVRVKQFDNVSSKEEQIRLVFLNGSSNQPWHYNSLQRWFRSLLKRAGVRHRGPNQCRHTFASQMLSRYVSLEWIARQLGHSDTSMIKKHYGRWMASEAPDMARKISQMLGYGQDDNGQENEDFAPILPK